MSKSINFINSVFLRGQITDRRICPQFSQQWRGLKALFLSGQIQRAKGTAFGTAPIYGTLTLLYILYIYICPKWVIVEKANKGAAFKRDRYIFLKCPVLSSCPLNT